MIGKLTIAIGLISLSGCSLFQPTAKPSEITLTKAMQDLGTGLKLMKMGEGDVKTGLIASDVTVVFNIAASDKKSGGLTIDMSAPIESGTGTGKATGNLAAESTSQRGNTVTIKFVNLLTIPKETLAYKGTLKEAMDEVKTPASPIEPYKGKLEVNSLTDLEKLSLDPSTTSN